MGFHFDVVRDEAGSPLRRNSAGNRNCTFVVGVVRIQQRENCARIPKNAPPDVHASRIACLSRAPGDWETPNARIASSIVNRLVGIALIVSLQPHLPRQHFNSDIVPEGNQQLLRLRGTPDGVLA